MKSFFVLMALLAATWQLSANPFAGGAKKSKHSTAVKSSSSKTHKNSNTRSGRKPARPARRSYQQAPTPERYKEIQQALSDKGYFKGTVDGKWGPDSVEALKQFQSEQNLDPDGKIGSLSLIALGLGPKRLSAQSAPQAAPPK